ncbi:hypothetical protein LTR28_008899 [Elasticomyces elasticus]|nr:hypothetical protein LTR28_008899 [Elasticomyces elasticus]
MAVNGLKRKRDDVELSRPRKVPQKTTPSVKKPKTNTPNKKNQEIPSNPATGAVEDSGIAVRSNATANPTVPQDSTVHIQIITGSYERVLHGITATIPSQLLSDHDSAPATTTAAHPTTAPPTDNAITYSDTFLFAAHASAIRCLAISPPSASSDRASKTRFLATGGTDERINLYSIATSAAPASQSRPSLPGLSGTAVAENARNRELGSQTHHGSSITRLRFAGRAKLLSASEDNSIAVSRTRDWTVLSTVRAPVPKAQGRPSGDTARPGEVPAGINDFAVHPSAKLMVSVGKGERAMRLWNLVSGKKAGVLQFDRDVLQSVGEGKRGGGGEGRQVVWAADGEEFAVAFERGVVVYGLDCTPRTTIRPTPPTKLHRLHYLPPSTAGSARTLLALSTEDGRILFYATEPSPSPQTTPLAQLGGGGGSRIKDFEVLHDAAAPQASSTLVVAGCSDGAVRVWRLGGRELSERWLAEVGGGRMDAEVVDAEGVDAEGVDVRDVKTGDVKTRGTHAEKAGAPQIGTLLSTHETGERITCLTAFVMDEEVDAIVPHARGDVEAGAVVAAAVEAAIATDDDTSSS